jgi:DNA repair photolyase
MVDRELKTDLGKGNFIFVGSMIDLWAREIPVAWVERVLARLACYPGNQYLLQTKNPEQFSRISWSTKNVIFAVTIESNRLQPIVCEAPSPDQRWWAFADLKQHRKMVSVEPVMDFDVDTFCAWIKDIQPEFVSIGADSKGHCLPEPSAAKLREFITELEKFTKVIQKPNLGRLL